MWYREQMFWRTIDDRTNGPKTFHRVVIFTTAILFGFLARYFKCTTTESSVPFRLVTLE